MTGFKLNRELAHYLREHPQELRPSPQKTTLSSAKYRTPQWRIRDRFSEQDIAVIVAEFKAGTPKHVLVKRYRIGMGSLKTLLREAGVKKRHRYDIQP